LKDADSSLKRVTAKWFWRMGCSTLLTVRLSTYETKPKGRIIELTDLDVLGIHVAHDFGVRFRTAECKSGKAGAKELFWLRGVSDFFGADEAYLVLGQEKLRSGAVRELAATLDLGAIVGSDFRVLLQTYPDSREDLQDLLFAEERIDEADRQLSNLGQSLANFNDYLRRMYWQLPPHRHLQLGVAPGVSEHLPVYLHGGEAGLREATLRIQAAEEVQRKLEGEQRVDLAGAFNALPPYYRDLLELVTRIGRRPRHCTPILRHLQVARSRALFADAPPMPDLMEAEYDPIAVKLVTDVIAFLVKASGVDPHAREAIGTLLDDVRPASGADAEGRKGDDDDDESEQKKADPSEQQSLRVD
jgi:hypothetical protein